jgi:hypothetical protein
LHLWRENPNPVLRVAAYDGLRSKVLFGHGIAGAAGFADDFMGIEINLPVVIGVANGRTASTGPLKLN